MVTVLSACMLLTVPTAPAPPATPAYYPTEVGTENVYVGGKSEFTLVVSAVAEKDGAQVMTMMRRSPREVRKQPHEIMSVSARGLFLVSSEHAPLDAPICLLKLPHRDGQRWDFDATFPGYKSTGTCTAHGPEQVKVPAGTFDAIRGESEAQVEGGELGRTTNWYAPGVGLVKMVSKSDRDRQTVEFQLKSTARKK
jgi:hypothetical protein